MGVKPSVGGLLLLAILALGFGVGFSGGGYGQTAAGVSVVGAALLAVIAAALIAGGLERMLPRGDAALGTVLLAAFALWALLTTAWSVRPDESLAWGALVSGYAATVFVAGAAARVSPRARQLVLLATLVGVLAFAAVALVNRLSPDATVTIGGLENARRLRGPLDYWNALGLVGALGILIAARQAVDAGRGWRWRALAGATVPPMAGIILLSQSRGALVALVLGMLLVGVCGGSGRLRMPLLVVASFAAAVPLAVTGAGRVAGDAVVAHSGRATVLAGALFAVVAGAVLALALRLLERRIAPWPGRRTVRIARVAATLGVVALLLGGVAFSVQQGGVGTALGKVRDQVASADKIAPVAGTERFLSVSSSNRADWWAEAVGAFSARPLAGWGAGSYGTVRKRYRSDYTEVAQPHSLPLQVLAETGVVGLVLLAAALWLLLRAAVDQLRRTPPGRERVLQATLIGVVGAWGIQACVDWDWDMPGVTIPALVALAVAAAAPATRRSPVTTAGRVAPATVVEEAETLDRRPRTGRRIGLLAGTFLAAVALAVVTVVPIVGERLADRAQDATAQGTTPEQLRDATGDAALAADLDPFSLRPLDIGRAISQRRQNYLEARRLALRGAERQPDNPQAWIGVAEVAGLLADRDGMRQAARRAVELDPKGVLPRTLLGDANGQLAPPEASATATATPLPAP
ncbi:O-antigen ligase family protein [Patulibacter defluvii]|uniref:O-antigen ligase family protein n=1 Tax=Patulibacter defluvii TaxID=3095358 RepID=UPI002A75142F|nr:O-antigen ligase family protein [Patulibacter sp. DM4]